METLTKTLLFALLDAEAGLEFAGADKEIYGEFIPTPTLALRAVREALGPYRHLLNNDQNVQEGDATDDDSSKEAGTTKDPLSKETIQWVKASVAQPSKEGDYFVRDCKKAKEIAYFEPENGWTVGSIAINTKDFEWLYDPSI
jgi:hypothetical protein